MKYLTKLMERFKGTQTTTAPTETPVAPPAAADLPSTTETPSIDAD
jgi:hypothetical protein